MKLLTTISASVLFAVSAIGADRTINQTVDTTTARVQPAAIGFFRGESVDYTVTPLFGSTPIAVSTNATATWTVATQTNILFGVLELTGTVSTNGVCVFSAAVSNTTMAAGAYDSFVRIQDGEELVTASRTTLNVYKSPYSEAITVVPFSFSEPLWVASSNSVVRTSQMGSGATWTGSNWIFAAGADDVSWRGSTNDWNTVTGKVDSASLGTSAYSASNAYATAAQGEKADTAAQLCGVSNAITSSLWVEGGASLVGQVATLVISSRVSFVTLTPILSFDFDSNASAIGASLDRQYWHNGGWTNELIHPCYSGSVFYASGGPDESTAITVSNITTATWGILVNKGVTNDLRETVVQVSTPTAGEQAATKAYVDASVVAVTPAAWANYPAVNNLQMNGHLILNNGWGLSMTGGVGIISYGDAWASTNAMSLAHNGTPIITLASGYSGLTVSGFAVDGGTNATLYVSTNAVMSAPIIETTTSLVLPNWQVVSATTDYPVETGGCYTYAFAVASGAYYRAVQLSGTNMITINGTLIADGSALTGLTVSQIANAVSNTDSRLTDARTPVAHSQPAESITNAPWPTNIVVDGNSGVVAGGIASVNVGGVWTPGDLLPLVSGTTCTVSLAMVKTNASWRIAPTGTVYFTAATDLTDTNIEAAVSLNVFFGASTFGWVNATMTNTATLTSNTWNGIIFTKPYGASVFTGR